MRRFLSILLLALIGLPLVAPLLGLGATQGFRLPACCRKNGEHHCMLSLAERSQSDQEAFAFKAPPVRCPYSLGTVVAAHGASWMVPAAEAIFASLVSHSGIIAQTESTWRSAQYRSRNKRGPPTHLL